MSKSGRPPREEEVKEEVLERLPQWRRELLRMMDRARSRAGEEAEEKHPLNVDEKA